MRIPRVLVVAAHPDDEVLGCGGTIARRCAEGAEVRILLLGEGPFSRRGPRPGKKSLESVRAQARRAAAALGAARVDFLGLPDNQFDAVPRLRIIQAIERAVERFRPETILTHSTADLNIDHRIAAEAVRTAFRPLPGATVREILAFEVPSSTEWRFEPARAFSPSVFISIQSHLETKLAALRAYAGELRPFPHPRSRELVEALAAVRGSQAGFSSAEAFELVRSIVP
ncbi:MAG: PIG-L deacetylase family protein [Elusimicrobiota bacterium]|jgi:LmbE family N-acetylglucosaminyl deacetylase